jgi:hypothetical protein
MKPEYTYEEDDVCIQYDPSVVSTLELDTIIRLIPHLSLKQTEVIQGQLDIHKKLLENRRK